MVVLISGEAGVGKTIMVEESLTAGNLSLFTGRAMEEAAPPYGLLVSTLREALAQLSGEALDCSRIAPQLGALLPELGCAPETTGTLPENHADVNEAFINAFSQLLARGPVGLFLDDLQWADEATLECLPLLMDRLREEKFLICGTYRSEEIPRGHRLRWLRNELRRRRQLKEIQLGSLSRRETGMLMANVLEGTPSVPLVNVVYQQTLGVPFFVEELSIALEGQQLIRRQQKELHLVPGKKVAIPESIRDAVLLRLDGLSDYAREHLEIAAIAGMEFDFSMISDLAGDAAGIDALIERGLISDTGAGRGAFRHALTREAIRDEVSWSRRRSLNRDIAEYLSQNGGLPELISEHWLAAGEKDKAREMLLQAAERSCQLYAYRDAAKATRRALDIWPEGLEEDRRLSALEKLAGCAQMSGQLAEAVQAWREVIDSAPVKAQPLRLAGGHRALATILSLQGAWEQSINARLTAGEVYETAGAMGEAATEILAAARRNYGMSNQEGAVGLCEKAIELALQEERWDIQARALALKGDVLTSMGQTEIGVATVQAGLSLALQHNLTDAASEVYRRLGSALEYASQFTASREAYYTAYNFCQTQGVVDQAQICLSCMTYVLFRTGDWKQCLEICREMMGDEQIPAGPRLAATGVCGAISLYRGETRSARKYCQMALDEALREKSLPKEMICTWSMAMIEQMEGNTERAQNDYLRILTLRDNLEDTHDALPMLVSAASFFAENRLDQELMRCVKAVSEMAAATGNGEALGTLAFVLGENALLLGEPEEATLQFRQAVEHFKRVEIPLELLKAELRTGVAFLQTRTPEAGLDHLRNAYRIARNLGCRPLGESAADLLKKMGETPEESRNPTSPRRIERGGLTTRQLEIARLIARGLTNKEIAAELFLSPRTVEMHVANLLNRLDSRTRAEAVKKVAEMGILD